MGNPLIYLTEISHLCLQKILDFIYIDGLVQKKHQSTAASVIKKLPDVENPCVIERTAEELIEPKQEAHQNGSDNVASEETMGCTSKEGAEPKLAPPLSLKSFSELIEFEAQNELKYKQKIINRYSKFPCDYCQYSATTKHNLKTHVLSKHEGVKFPCDYCDFRGSTKGNTRAHMKKMHSAMI